MAEYIQCYFCGHPATERHHVFQGAYRHKSEVYGYVLQVCDECHTRGPKCIHQNRELRLRLKQDAQRHFEQTHTRDEFRAVFGKSYILEDEE